MQIQLDSLDFYVLRLIDETGQYVEIDLREELKVNEDNLDREMLEQPAKYVYWSSILEKLRLYLESSELELEILLGDLDAEAREAITAKGDKPTKDSVDGYIKRDERYKAAKSKCNYYVYLVKRVQFIVKAFEQRKDMLQSYGKQIVHDKQYGHKAGRHIENQEFYDYPPPPPYNT